MSTSYSTSFSGTENPISEGGVWITGGGTGLDWSNPKTTGGLCTTAANPTPLYGDAIAVVSGTWGNDHWAQATVFTQNTENGSDREIELLLRFDISAHTATGYEIDFNVGDGLDQLLIVSWNGILGDFTILSTTTGSTVALASGDIVYAQVVGNVITVKINGTQVVSYTDNSNLHASGKPGVGFYLTSNTTTVPTDFGWSAFSASDSFAAPPVTPSPLRTYFSSLC